MEKWYRDAKLYNIFDGTSEIQRIVISHALGASDGAPPLHIDLQPSGGPLNRMSAAAHRHGPGRQRGAVDAGSGSAADHLAGNEGATAAAQVAWSCR